MTKSLVIGAGGQIGTELVAALANANGASNVVAADLGPDRQSHETLYESLDVLDMNKLRETVIKHRIDHVYQLAALLSATGEKEPLRAWNLNMAGLLNVLELAREGLVKRLFWPSSIAAFGPNTPPVNTPQFTVMDPTTIYGVSKQAGERLCEYYHSRFGVDVRSIRYPGIISYKAPPGGGTTDYAISIFHSAKRGEIYRCFLKADTTLPMIFMDDAIRATMELMHAPDAAVQIRSSYNVAGTSFSPAEIADAIASRVPGFRIEYVPDFRQQIAQSWPQSLDDTHARCHWSWKPRFSLQDMVDEMLTNVSVTKALSPPVVA